MMLLTGEFPGTERASGAGRWKASFTVSWPFSSSQPPQLTSCHPEERNKSASCAWVSLALPLTLFQGDRKSPLFQLFLETQSPGTLLTSQINRTRQTLQDAMRPSLMREWLRTTLPSIHVPVQPEAVSMGLSSCVTNQHTGLTWGFGNRWSSDFSFILILSIVLSTLYHCMHHYITICIITSLCSSLHHCASIKRTVHKAKPHVSQRWTSPLSSLVSSDTHGWRPVGNQTHALTLPRSG